jgi:hypothetical protein
MRSRTFAATLLLTVTGCTYSVHPLLTENELADDIDLSGTWYLQIPGAKPERDENGAPTGNSTTKKKAAPVTVTLNKWDDSTYDIVLGENGDKLIDRKRLPLYPDTWKLQIGRVGGELYAQIIPLDNLSGPPIFSGIPVYTFGRLEIKDDCVRFYGLQDNNSAVLAEKHTLPHIVHSPSEFIDLTIFTGSPKELQAMVQTHGDLLFRGGHSATLTRVPENTSSEKTAPARPLSPDAEEPPTTCSPKRSDGKSREGYQRCAIPAQSESMLRWKLEIGKVLHYRIQEEARFGSDEQGLTEKLVMETTWTVTAAQADVWQITVRVDRIRFTCSGNIFGEGFEVAYDSSDNTAQGRGAEALSELFDVIVGCDIQLTLDSLGSISDPKLPENLVDQFNQTASAELAGFFGDTVSMVGLKRAIFLVGLPLREAEVSAGSDWKHEYKLKLGQGLLTGNSGVTTYSSLGRESGSGLTLEKIGVQSQEELLFTQKGKSESLKREVDGVAYFDHSNGSLFKRTSKRKQGTFMHMKTTVERIEPPK